MRSSRAFVILAVVAASACSRDISAPGARNPVGLAAADLGLGGAGDVVVNGATPDNPADDDGPAIQAALNASAHVYFPAGTYHVDEGLVIPSGDTISGAGGAAVTIVQRNPSVYYVFTSSGASNITVQDVGFQAANLSTQYQFGYKAVDVHNLSFLRNRATDTGLLQTTVSANVDSTPGFTNSMLSSNVRIENNHGVGPAVDANGHYAPGYGIWLRFTRDVSSFGNFVQRYQFGIGWDGGEGDPAKQTDTLKLKNRWAKQMVFEQDTAKDVDAGIWGSRGDSIHVNHGWVEHCRDVCLDAEGSTNVTFFNNQARYAGNAVLSVFHYSSGVYFSWNDVRQDGRLEKNLGDTVAIWRQMFWSSFAGGYANGVTATLANNFFTYEGSSSFGLISKSPMAVFAVDNNWLRNTLIDVDMNNAGAVHITGDSITLTRPMGQPAIKVGHNYMGSGAPAPFVNSSYRVEIGGNNIYLGYPTLYAQGILLTESTTSSVISSWIHHNNIRGMSSAIQAVSCGSACPVLIENNTVTGSITPSSSSGSVTVRNNTRVQ